MITDLKSITITLCEGGVYKRQYNAEDEHQDSEEAQFTVESTRRMASVLIRAAMELSAWMDGCLIEEKKKEE